MGNRKRFNCVNREICVCDVRQAEGRSEGGSYFFIFSFFFAASIKGRQPVWVKVYDLTSSCNCGGKYELIMKMCTMKTQSVI